ncbi:MAG: LysR family transcriptional regulator [Alphaproteobacteria bacterium]|nr:MAG: LysR family transcriptional regulator [Alphaproteobacteria bacterium]
MSQQQGRRRSGREDIEIKDLRNFVVVAEELNITRAAARLGTQQSPLSRTLRSLQQQLGVALIDTTGNRLSITPAGSRMLVEARRILQQVADLYPQAQAGDQGQHLRIGFSFSAGGRMPQLLERMRHAAPSTTASLVSATALASPFDYDVLLAPARPPIPGIIQNLLWQEPLWAAVPGSHTCSSLSSPLFSELLLLGTVYHASDLKYALGHLPRSLRLAEVPYLDVAMVDSLVSSHHCSVLIPESLCYPMQLAGLLLRPVADVPPMNICAHTVEANQSGCGPWLARLWNNGVLPSSFEKKAVSDQGS